MAVDEGPFQNFVGVHWSEAKFYISTWANFPPIDSVGVISPYPPGRELASDAAMQKIFTGDTSGAVLDLRNLPTGQGQLTATTPVSPDCLRDYTNGFDLSGSPVASAPSRAYGITIDGATILALSSRTNNPTFMICDVDLNGVGLGVGFIMGETVTASSEPSD